MARQKKVKESAVETKKVTRKRSVDFLNDALETESKYLEKLLQKRLKTFARRVIKEYKVSVKR